jgi:hypothetical protein
MDQMLSTLFSWQFLILSFGLYAITTVIRRIVEFVLDNPKVPASKTSKLWTELLLPVGPILNGALVGWLVKSFPYPEGISSTSGRVFFGLVAGFFSAKMYRILKSFIKSKLPDNLQKELEDETDLKEDKKD